ncbi:MAG TPA: hypothetical protein VGU68_19130 [Ktedonobacteraceae bacterium]|nr:hypothetical protein [Ktedonobacteraceae bacterium]
MSDRVTIIALDASGTVISRVNVSVSSGKQPLQGVMAIARNMLRIKGCVSAEIHAFVGETAIHEDVPLEVVQREELFWGNASQTPSLKGV